MKEKVGQIKLETFSKISQSSNRTTAIPFKDLSTISTRTNVDGEDWTLKWDLAPPTGDLNNII